MRGPGVAWVFPQAPDACHCSPSEKQNRYEKEVSSQGNGIRFRRRAVWKWRHNHVPGADGSGPALLFRAEGAEETHGAAGPRSHDPCYVTTTQESPESPDIWLVAQVSALEGAGIDTKGEDLTVATVMGVPFCGRGDVVAARGAAAEHQQRPAGPPSIWRCRASI